MLALHGHQPMAGRLSVALAGGPRAIAPGMFWARLRPVLPRLGITRVGLVTGLDRIGLPVAMAVRPAARGLAVNHGKGATELEARLSAAMESLEHWHAENPALPAVAASPRALRARATILEPADLPGTGLRLDPDREILWLPGRDLASGEPVQVPLEAVSTDYALPPLEGFGALAQTSSGLASGTDRDEALAQALLERIERDAEALWQLTPAAARAARRVDPATVTAAAAGTLLARIAGAALACAIWDLTTDLGVAAFRCLLIEPRPERGAPLAAACGTGCALDRDVALWRALAEAAQMRLLQITAAREDLTAADYAPPDRARLRRLRALALAATPRSFASVPSTPHAGFAADRGVILARLAAAGMTRAVAVDLTNPTLMIPVVRVVVPGLEEVLDGAGPSTGRRAARLLAEVPA